MLAGAGAWIAWAPAHAAPAWLGGSEARVEVEVRERVGEDVWEVHYQLPERAAGVEFLRSRHAYRHVAWGVAPAGSRWLRDGDRERLCFPAPARLLAVSFRTDTTQRPKDYQVNSTFSDGSRLLYTGGLLLRPLAACGDEAAPPPPAGPAAAEAPAADPPHHFRFVTDAGRALRVVDRSGTGSLDWEPELAHAETYAFFGPAPAQESDRATLVLDPTLPEWVGRDLRALLPRLFERYAAETGIELGQRPLLLLSYRPEGSGMSFKGGVLDRVLAMDLSGEGWQTESEESRRNWFLRLAHEAFHFWGGSELLADEESEWLSEAAAELFALRAAWGLEVLSYERYEAALVDAGNQCLVGLEGGSLLSAPERGAYETWYTCGTIILFAADRAVERGSPGQGGISLLFRKMFEEGRLAGNRYGTGVFLGWLDKLSGERDTVHALQRLIRRGVERRTDAFLLEVLEGAGLRVTLVPPEETTGDPAALRLLLRKGLTRCACGTARPESSGEGDCARFAPGNRIVRVGGVEVRADAAAAYGRFKSGALLGRPLEVVTGDEPSSVTLLCPRDVLEPSFEKMLRLR
jgi:hypothetical protein